MRILTTNLRPDAGRATVLGVDVVANPRPCASASAWPASTPAVDENLTGRENLRLVGRLTHQPRKLASARGPTSCSSGSA